MMVQGEIENLQEIETLINEYDKPSETSKKNQLNVLFKLSSESVSKTLISSSLPDKVLFKITKIFSTINGINCLINQLKFSQNISNDHRSFLLVLLNRIIRLENIENVFFDLNIKNKNQFISLFAGGIILHTVSKIKLQLQYIPQETDWISHPDEYTKYISNVIILFSKNNNGIKNKNDNFSYSLIYSQLLIKSLSLLNFNTSTFKIYSPFFKSLENINLLGSIIKNTSTLPDRFFSSLLTYIDLTFLPLYSDKSSILNVYHSYDEKISAISLSFTYLFNENHIIQIIQYIISSNLSIFLLRSIVTFISSIDPSLSIPFFNNHLTNTFEIQPKLFSFPLFTFIYILQNYWSNSVFISYSSTYRHQIITNFLLLLISNISSQNHGNSSPLKNISKSRLYLESVSKYLSLTHKTQTRLFGLSVAQFLSAKTDPKSSRLNFEQDDLFRNKIDKLLWDNITETNDKILKDETSLVQMLKVESKPIESLNNVSNSIDIYNSKPNTIETISPRIPKEFVPFTFPEPSDSESDSDDEASYTKKKRIHPPVYIRQLIDYLADTSDEDANESYQKVNFALKYGPDLILRKCNYGTEVSEHAKELSVLVACLRDKFSIDSFETMRLYILYCLIVSCPMIVPPFLISTLSGKRKSEYSLQQKLVILSSISMSAITLGGYDGKDDSEFHKNLKELSSSHKVRIKKLSEKAHNKFISSSNKIDSLVLSSDAIEIINNATSSLIEIESINKAKNIAEDKLSSSDSLKGAKTIWASKSLNFSSQEKKLKIQGVENKFSNLASEYFFFPVLNSLVTEFNLDFSLISSSFNNNRFDNNTDYSCILISHYLNSLSIILFSSYPSCPEIHKMTDELISISSYFLTQIPSSLKSNNANGSIDNYISIYEGSLNCMSVILMVNSGEYLIDNHTRTITEVHDFLQENWERIFTSSKSRSLGASLIIQLGKLLDKYQRRIIGL